MNETNYVVCVRNEGYPASLELRKIYNTLPDVESESHGFIRVIDESGEDYLYPTDFFMPIEIPRSIVLAFDRAS